MLVDCASLQRISKPFKQMGNTDSTLITLGCFINSDQIFVCVHMLYGTIRIPWGTSLEHEHLGLAK